MHKGNWLSYFKLTDIIEYAFYLESQNVIGEFYLREDDIKKYIYFYLVSNNKQQHANKKSIITICKEKYLDGIYKDEDTIFIMDDPYFRSFYERILEHYSKFNYGKTIEAELKRGNIKKRYEGNQIYDFQMHEFDALEELFLETTYKRIRSNKLHNIKYTDYEMLVNELKDRIKNSDLEFKNIQLYKLEKRFNLELIKCMLTVIAKTKKKERKNVIKDLILTFLIPEIDTRQKYLEIYCELNNDEKLKWRREIIHLSTIFIPRVIITSTELIDMLFRDGEVYNLTDKEETEFKKIYYDEKYVNEYKINKDFKNIHFKELMVEIQNINDKFRTTVDEIIKKIKRN
ncbi:hypothetical protein [Caminicella sporogenes]|uniref:hypothetical protein n=1 Tax=Caminicella sporogenes TaxID=166485 RepID=UPI0025410FBA|nr:hypothetical protein [Caminicella sporogenes]WIF94467.1 hypothetical protein QNI18_09375 [Caminicella sporogenes]